MDSLPKRVPALIFFGTCETLIDMKRDQLKRQKQIKSALRRHSIGSHWFLDGADAVAREQRRKLQNKRRNRKDLSDDTYRILAVYMLASSFDGATQKAISDELGGLGYEFSSKKVGNYLRKAADRVATRGYDTLLLKPGKRDRPSNFKFALERQLVELRKCDVTSWTSWSLDELTFFLQTGICPPERHRSLAHAIQQAQAEIKRAKVESKEKMEVALKRLRSRYARFDDAWYEDVVNSFCKSGEMPDIRQGEVAAFEKELRKYKDPKNGDPYQLIRLKLIAPVKKGPSPKYVQRMLYALGYRHVHGATDKNNNSVPGLWGVRWKKMRRSTVPRWELEEG